MAFGNYLVIGSIILSLIGILISFIRLYTKDRQWILYSRIVTMVLFITITVAVLYLYMLFITSDLSVEYVWTYTDSSYSLAYKLSGFLAGMAGSLLFWVWMVIIPWFYEEMKAVKHPKDDDFMDWTRIFVYAALLALLFILYIHEIFRATPAEWLAYSPNGNGMNPILQTFLMAIHPPLVFVAYGLLVIPFAAGLAYLITGESKWTDICLNWSRIGWLFLTLGIGIGALWAYVVLGWGGYWGWDPVETSSLLPWILLTGFLHVQFMYRRKKDYKILAPVLGAFTFILVIFATFATRAGGLWVSVHTFGQADVSIDAWTRFKNVLAESDTVSYYFTAQLIMMAVTIVLALYRQRQIGNKSEDRTYTLSELINDDILMLATTFLFVLITSVTLLILVRGVNGLAAENFNAPIGILVIALILVMMFCICWRLIGRRHISQITLGTIIASLVSIMLYPGNVLVAGAFPILLVSMVLISFVIIKRFNMLRPWQSLKLISAHLIHLAVVLLVIGYVSSNFLSEDQVVSMEVGDASPVEALGYEFKTTSIVSTNDYIFTDIEVWQGNKLIGQARPGISVIDGHMRSEIKIVETLTEDIYLIYDYDELSYGQNIVDVEVKVLPMMKFLWGGMWLLCIGIVLRIAAEFILKINRSEPGSEIEHDGDEDDDQYEDDELDDEGAIVKDDDYYESLLEAELETAEVPEMDEKEIDESPKSVEKIKE